MKKVYVVEYKIDAGSSIYRGYKSAWEAVGYDVEYYGFNKIDPTEKNAYIMASDHMIKTESDYLFFNAFKKVFLFVQQNHFPLPWGLHPNWYCEVPVGLIEKINKEPRFVKWTFAEVKPENFDVWKNVHHVPLAFDNINYLPEKSGRHECDAIYIGSRANNGFDEKIKLMFGYHKELIKSNLKFKFFIDAKLSLEDEYKYLFNSKVCLNIHDEYQRKFGLDTNERTYKTLGLNGACVMDEVAAIKSDTGLDIFCANNTKEYVEHIRELVFNDKLRNEYAERNRKHVLENHTYLNRVRTFEKLAEDE